MTEFMIVVVLAYVFLFKITYTVSINHQPEIFEGSLRAHNCQLIAAFFFTGNEVITGSKPKIILLVFRLTFNLNHRVCYTMKLRNNMLIFVHWKPSEVNLSIPWEFAIDWISIKFMIQQIMRETTKSNARTSN